MSMIRKDLESWETQIHKLGSVRRAVMDIHNGLPIQVTWEDLDSWTGLHIDIPLPPRYILFKLDETKAQSLDGLPEGMFPIEPASCRYMLDVDGHQVTAERKQEPVTGGYAFTGYHSQGQMMPAVIVDLAKPPSGKQMSFGAYVALSQS